MFMKNYFLTALMVALSLPVFSQDYAVKVQNVTTEVKFYSPQIVRVTKYQSSDPQAKTDPKFVVTMTPQNVGVKCAEGSIYDTLSTDGIKVICNKKTGLLSFYRSADGTLLTRERNRAVFTARTSHTIDKYNVSQTFSLASGETIYGFGQVQDGNLNHRNTNYSHMVQNNTSVWMPYMHSVNGYGIYWDLYGPCDFSDNANGATFATEAAHAIDYYVLLGSRTDGDEVIRRVRELTGQATMVPLWTFGYFQSKERYKSSKETLGVLKKYRSLGVPIDCVVQDWQYWGGNNQWNAMDFLNPEFSSDYRDMIDGVHDDGGHLLISIWANFGRDTKQFAHYRDKNQLMKQGDRIMSATWPNGEGVGIYNPYEQSSRDYYWNCLNSGLVNRGVDAYWVDSSEPDHYQGGEDWEQTNDFIVLHKNGTDDASLNSHSIEADHTWRSVRNIFPLMHASGVYDGHRAQNSSFTNAKRVMIMTRSGFLGMQRYGAGTWSGDITSSWQTLANQIPAALNYSACGIPSWNSDIGGFFNGEYAGPGEDRYNELYARWIQFGAFCTIMRSHGSGVDRAIYQYGSRGESYYDIIERYINLRYALLPYIYSTDRKVHAEGFTFMRAMGIAFPADKMTHQLKDQFMFGRDILVAPVVKQGAETKDVYLPQGKDWVDVWTGEHFNGGQTVTKNVSLAVMPLYVPAGTIMPWGPKVQYSSESNWDKLEIRIYRGADGSFTLYEDERDNYNYELGKFSEITFGWDDANSTLTIDDRKGEFNGMLKDRTFRIVLVDKDKNLGLGLRQSARFSKVVEYSGKKISVKVDNENLEAEQGVAVKSLNINPTSVSLYAGQASNLKVEAVFADGTRQYVTLDSEFESSDPNVAYVVDGVIRTRSENGKADIKVKYTDVTGKVWTRTLKVTVSVPTNLYSWKAYDWFRNRVADRLGASDIKYDNVANTITITKTGAQNIALRYNSTGKFLKPGLKYLVVVASEVSRNKADSQLWYINGSWVNIVNPDKVVELKDGRILLAWNMNETDAYLELKETVFGLTSTNASGRSVISYVGFEADVDALADSLNKEIVSIDSPRKDVNGKERIYSLLGVSRKNLEDGINIVQNTDGDVRKVLK